MQTRVSVARGERQVQVPGLALRRPGQMAALLVRLPLAASPDGSRTSEAGSLCPEPERRPGSNGSTEWPACRPGLPRLHRGLRRLLLAYFIQAGQERALLSNVGLNIQPSAPRGEKNYTNGTSKTFKTFIPYVIRPRKLKDNPEWENVFANHTLIRNIYPEYVFNSYNNKGGILIEFE